MYNYKLLKDTYGLLQDNYISLKGQLQITIRQSAKGIITKLLIADVQFRITEIKLLITEIQLQITEIQLKIVLETIIICCKTITN